MGHCIIQRITVQKTTVLLPDMLDVIFPIGKIYITESDSVSPSDLFGGDWEQVIGCYLKTCDDSTVGEIGGSNYLNPAQGNTQASVACASHCHWMIRYYWVAKNSTGGYGSAKTKKNGKTSYTGGGGSHTHTLGGHIHELNPKRTCFYIWKRIG